MNKNRAQGAALVAALLVAASANAVTDWSTQDYDLYPGDFDGDGKTDLLYVAKDASKASGIARSDGSAPSIPFQSWPSNYLGIPWSGNQYSVIVADFNGDLKADVLLQRATAGDSYLLLADANGKLTAINQTISNTWLSLNWSADQHRILAGDFNNDGKADLFLQATRSVVTSGTNATNAVVFADSGGQFTTGPTQTWTDASWSAFKWSTQNSNIFLLDYNGDGMKDLLIQARPKFVMIDYDVPIPVPTYPPNMNGVVKSLGSATPFQQSGVQQWSRTANGVDWSPLSATVVVGDFNGDGRADVLLQARNSSRPTYLLAGNASGAAFASGAALATNVTWSSDAFRLIAGNFDGTGGAGVYYQALTSAGTNYYANVVTGATVTATAHNPGAATGVLPTSAVGHTVGSFAVADSGSATYSIPIVVPPGVAGVQPQLSIDYASGGGNGLLGVGWGVAGLSEISRCNKTIAQDDVSEAATLATSDRLCMDGNRLRRTGGAAYGVAGSTYQTELETFSRVTAVGVAGNGPASFLVESKAGLKYEYGNSSDSRIEAANSASPSTARTWALNKVTDRHGNSMTISYQEDGAPNGSYRPSEISYTSNTGLAAAYKVVFFHDPRPATDTLTGYVLGGSVRETYRLNRIETQYNEPGVGWRLVRKYQLSYNSSGATPRTRLGSVQECDRNGNCLAPTMVGWQEGVSGWSSTDTTSSTNSSALLEYSYPLDINGDGRDDLVYPETVSGTTRWHYMLANSAGSFGTPFNTGLGAGDATSLQYAKGQVIDYFGEGREGLLIAAPGFSNRQILRWNGTTLAFTDTNLTIALQGNEWISDFDGDGRQDIMYTSTSGGVGSFNVRRNSGSTSGQAQFNAAQVFYSTSFSGTLSPFLGEQANHTSRLLDFNGDGRADILYATIEQICPTTPCTNLYTTTWNALMSTGTAFTPILSWTCSRGGNPCPAVPMLGDYNGDGMTDAVTNTEPCCSTWRISYGTGTGLTAPAALTMPGDFNTGGFSTDYNSDGRADLVYAATLGANWSVLVANGTGFDAAVLTTVPSSSTSNNTYRVMDFDGDGLQDIGYKSTQFRVRKHNGQVPDFVSSITDGFGNNVSVQYAPLTDTAIYTKCPINPVCPTSATFPQAEIQPAMYVVKSYTASDGIGGSYSVTQKYTGLRVHAQGRGLLGFVSRDTIDGRTGIKTTSIFRQDFPYIGFESQTTTYQSDGVSIISQTVNTPAELLPVQGGPFEERRFPYVQQSEQTNREVGVTSNNLLIARITTTQSIDGYGNVTNVTATTSDLTGSGQMFQASKVNTYDAVDLTNWCMGFLTDQTVTNTVPGLVAKTRAMKYTKDTPASLCRVRDIIVEPGADTTIKVTTTLGYDSRGNANTQTVTALGIDPRSTSTDFGSQGVFPMSTTNALGQIAYKTYDFALGVPKTATDLNGLVSEFYYDGFGRLVRAVRPDDTETEFVYSACTVVNGYCGDSRLRYQVEKREKQTNAVLISTSRSLVDALGRSLYDQAQAVSGADSSIATNYDNQGRVSQRSQPYFSGMPAYFTTVTYDLIGRPLQEARRISETNAATQSVAYEYDRLSHKLTDANGKVTIKEFNAIGQVVKMTDAANGITRYEYNQFGNLTKAIDPANNEIVSTFNIRGFKLTSNDPDMGNWLYEHYPTGELKKQTNAKGQVVDLTYDRLSRPLTRIEPEGTTTFVYGDSIAAHNIGKIASVGISTGAFSESFTYDQFGRIQDATTNIDGTDYVVSHSYNATSGALETLTYPTSTSAVPGSRFKVQYEYASGLLKRVRDFNTPATIYWEQIATDASGRAVDELLGNGLHTYSTFDAVNGLLGEIETGATSQVQNLRYQWDKLGNLTQRQDLRQGLTEAFTYDDLYRLQNSTLNGAPTHNLQMAYNATGNILTKTEGASSTSYNYTTQQAGCTYDFSHTQPHAVRKFGTTVYCYDKNGNMVKRGGSNITWYSYNLPNRIDQGSNYAQFFYGTDRSRYKQIAFTASGGVLPAGTETTLYVRGVFEKVTKPSGVIEYKHSVLAGQDAIAIRTLRSSSINDTRYLHKDHLGSVDAITNESGAVVLRLSYDAFGKRRNWVTWSGAVIGSEWTQIAALTHRGFTFHEQLDNVELVHMNGRVYDPNIGRFISADPIVQAPLLSQSLNRYSYVMNNPLSLIDPSGYSWFSKHFKKLGRWFKRQWDSFRHNLTRIAGFALVIAGGFLQNPAIVKAGMALIASPVQVHRGRDGVYLTFTYAGFDVDPRAGSTISTGGGGGTPPPMTAPTGAVALNSLPNWLVDEIAGAGDAMTLGVGRIAREYFDLGSVDTSSGSYKTGFWGTTAIMTVLSAGSNLLPRAAAGGVSAAVVTNNTARGILATPKVGSSKLQNIINDLYKGTTNPARVGNGTTADAIRHELATGQAVGGRYHSQKGADYARGLENWLRANPDALYQDRLVAQSVLDDLRSALGGGP